MRCYWFAEDSWTYTYIAKYASPTASWASEAEEMWRSLQYTCTVAVSRVMNRSGFLPMLVPVYWPFCYSDVLLSVRLAWYQVVKTVIVLECERYIPWGES